MTLKGVGQLAYECRAKAGAAAAYEWAFAGPDALLQDSRGNQVGNYYGGPTWEHRDGTKVGGKQLAVSPGGAGNTRCSSCRRIRSAASARSPA